MFEELQNAQKAQGNNEELKRQPFKNCEADFKEKLEYYDCIEGYNREEPEKSFYQRSIVTAHIIDNDGQETGETVQTYIYHIIGLSRADHKPVKGGDWLLRDK